MNLPEQRREHCGPSRGGCLPASFQRRRQRWRVTTGCLVMVMLPLVTTLSPAEEKSPAPATNAAAKGEVLTLGAAIVEALQKAPIVRAADRDRAAADEQVNANRGLRHGEMDAVLTAKYLNDDQLLRPISGPLSPAAIGSLPFTREQVHAGAVYTYPLYDGKRIANRIKLAQLGAERAKTLVNGTRADVTYNGTALFAQAQALGAQAEAIQQEIDTLDTTRQHVELAVQVGKRAGVDLLKIQDRIAEAKAHRASVLARQKQVIAALMKVIGRDAAQPVTLAPLPPQLPQLSTQQPDLAAAATKRSSVTAAKLAAAQRERQLAVARAALKPMVAAEASYLRHADPGALDDSEETWFLGVTVGLPLFDGGRRRATVRKNREEAAAARERAAAARLQAAAELQSALAGWQAAQQQLTAANAQYDAAREVARIEQLRYDTGAGDIEDLLRARTREVAAESTQIAARALIIVSAAQINHVVEQEVVR